MKKKGDIFKKRRKNKNSGDTYTERRKKREGEEH